MSPCVCMEDIDDQVIKSVSMYGRGTIVFPVNFISPGEGASILKVLQRLLTEARLLVLLEESILTQERIRSWVLGLGGSQEKSYRSMIKFSQRTDMASGFPTTRS